VGSDPRRPDPLPDREVLRLSKRYLSRGGIIPTGHFKGRMNDRKITMTDLFSVIEGGTIAKAPEWNKDFQEYNYFIKGKDIEGEEVTVNPDPALKRGTLGFPRIYSIHPRDKSLGFLRGGVKVAISVEDEILTLITCY